MTDIDEHLYRNLKQLESSAQAALFSLPQKESPAYKALNLIAKDEWRIGALIEHLIWLQEKAKSTATAVYMQGKD